MDKSFRRSKRSVTAPTAVNDAGDDAGAVVPAVGRRAFEGYEELLAGEDGHVGLHEQTARRDVQDAGSDQLEVALADDFAVGGDRAAEEATGTIGMQGRAHAQNRN